MLPQVPELHRQAVLVIPMALLEAPSLRLESEARNPPLKEPLPPSVGIPGNSAAEHAFPKVQQKTGLTWLSASQTDGLTCGMVSSSPHIAHHGSTQSTCFSPDPSLTSGVDNSNEVFFFFRWPASEGEPTECNSVEASLSPWLKGKPNKQNIYFWGPPIVAHTKNWDHGS